ncbi:MAG TPA: glycosidase [Phycisphaerales bacterium]|nr:glycosidase [Phycisphaerales bacterium]
MLVHRLKENPLITPADVPPSRDDYEVVGAFNPGVTVFNDEILLLLRVAERPRNRPANQQVAPVLDPATGKLVLFRVKNDEYDLEVPDSRSFTYKGQMYLTSISHLRLARSTDGVHFTIDPQPAVFPQTLYETFGLEDPRISRIGDDFYIAYKVVSEYGIATGLLRTRDFVQFERQGIIFCPENLDVAIFPERIGGKLFALTRPVPRHIGPRAIWLASSEDGVRWGNHWPLLPPRPGHFDGGKTGASCVPIRTKEGWLEIYHGADESDRYSLGAALLDLDDPTRVLARSREPLMQPEADYEIRGFYGNVVFSCGAWVTDRGEVTLYYGASDEATAAATTTIDRIMDTLE